jgi:hypothetical protein
MKKFFFTLAVIVIASVSMISCADEDVKVKGDSIGASGGSGSAKGF